MEAVVFGNKAIRYVKAIVGYMLLVVSLSFSIVSFYKLIQLYPVNPVHAVEVFLSDILLVLVMLELAKTVFSFLEGEGYLHSIMEASFIAVLREVILLEIRGITLEKGIVLALLIVVIGYVYYRLHYSK